MTGLNRTGAGSKPTPGPGRKERKQEPAQNLKKSTPGPVRKERKQEPAQNLKICDILKEMVNFTDHVNTNQNKLK
jgi:hypothetical protein